MNAIQPIRKALGITQVALASAIKCSQPNVARYEIAPKATTPPAALALRLVEHCASAGLQITLEHVYGLAPLPVTSACSTDNSSPA